MPSRLRIALTPPASATSQSPACRPRTAWWTATRLDEQAVFTAIAGPRSPNAYATRPGMNDPSEPVRSYAEESPDCMRSTVQSVDATPKYTPVRVSLRAASDSPASSNASQPTWSAMRCCGSSVSASESAIPKNPASNWNGSVMNAARRALVLPGVGSPGW
jgi:hypothetical protein